MGKPMEGERRGVSPPVVQAKETGELTLNAHNLRWLYSEYRGFTTEDHREDKYQRERGERISRTS
jgi:hypothetical protein